MTSRIEMGIETIASGVIGAVKATKGRVLGLTGVFAHLAREHGKVTGLLLRLKVSSDPALRAELFPKIRTELLSHERAELAEVFPVFAQHAELAGFAEEHRRDAATLEVLIDDLSKTSPTDELWPRRLGDLIENVNQHAIEEENDFFPKASRVLGKKKTEHMLPRFEAAKSKIASTLEAPVMARKAAAKSGKPAARSGKPAAKSGKPAKPTAIVVRAEPAANRVARRKKAATPSRAPSKRAGVSPRKTKAGAGTNHK